MKQNLYVTAFVTLLLLGACQKDQSQLVKEAISLRLSGDFAGAKKKLQQAINLGPSAEAYKELGNYYLLSEDNLDEAEANYLASLKLDPSYINSIHNLGLVQIKRYENSQDEKGRGDVRYLDHAKGWLDKALSLNPNFALSHQEYAKYYFYLKKYDQALASGQRAIRLDPRAVRAYIILGQIYLKGKKDIKSAMVQFEQAYAFDRNSPEALYYLYVVHSKAGNREKADYYYSQYILLLKNQNLSDAEIKQAEEQLQKNIKY